MSYIGFAASTGCPVEIPALTRSLAAFLFGRPQSRKSSFGLDFKMLQLLDVGTLPGDPGAVVERYEHDWWIGSPSDGFRSTFNSSTLHVCLGLHRKIAKYVPSATTYEKHLYGWGRGILFPTQERDQCQNCQRMHGIVTAATDELRELRTMVDGFETYLDVERRLVERRASGLHGLIQAAELKETETGAMGMDADTGIQQRTSVAPPEFVPGAVRRPKKGPEVVKRVRQAAVADLAAFQSRPNLKWTWGTDLEIADLKDLLGSGFNNALDGSHSGYDTSLRVGCLTGDFSDTVPFSDSSDDLVVFDVLSPDIIEPRELEPMEIPTLFNHFPFARRYAPDSEFVDNVAAGFAAYNSEDSMDKAPIIERSATPDLEITTFVVPHLPLSTSFPVGSRPSGKGLTLEPRTPKIQRARAGDFTSPSAERVADVQSITLSYNPDLPLIDWLTPVASTRGGSPGAEPGRSDEVNLSDDQSASDEDIVMEENITEEMAGSRRRGQDTTTMPVTVGTLLSAWSSSEGSPVFPGMSVGVSELAGAWESEEEKGLPAIGVSELAGAWESDDETGAAKDVSTPGVSTAGVGVTEMAGAWESDDGREGSENPKPLEVDVSDLAGVWKSAEGSPADESSVREGSPACVEEVTLQDVTGLFHSDSGSEDDDEGQHGSVDGPYNAESFANIPDDWLAGL